MSTIGDRWPLKIGERRFVTNLKALDKQRIGSLVQTSDTSAEASDLSISNDGLWRKTRSNFEEGLGQEWVDLTEESVDSNSLRFWWSRGIDALSNPGKFSVLPGTTSETTVGSGDTGKAVQHLGYVYAASGVAATRSDLNDLGTWTVCTGEPGGVITDMVVLAGKLYICDGTGVNEVGAGGLAFSAFSTIDTDYMVGGSGSLLGMHDRDVWEFTDAGLQVGSANIHSHFDAAFAWKGGIAAPNGVYIFGDAGDHSEVYLLNPTDATGEFAAPYPVMELNDEIIHVMKFYAGIIVMGTSKGIRLAQIGGSGFLTYGPLIDVGDVLDLYKAPEGEIYFTWSVFNDVDGSQLDSGVGRMSLDRFTQPLVPAYQSDVMAATTGTVRCVAGLNGRVLFGLDTTATLGIYVKNSTGVLTTSYFRPGRIVFGSAELKSLTSFEIKTSDLAGNIAVSIEVDGTSVSLDADETTRQRKYIGGVDLVGEEFNPLITLTSVTGDVDRWTLRAIVLLRRAKAWTFPVLLASNVSDYGRVMDRRDPMDDWAYLESLCDDPDLVPIIFGAYEFRGRVDDVYLAQNASTELITDWTKKGSDQFIDSVWLVRVIENTDG